MKTVSFSRRSLVNLNQVRIDRLFQLSLAAVILFSLPSALLLAGGQDSGQVLIEQMGELGNEGKQLGNSVGEWDVVFSLWSAPSAEPKVTRDLLAVRKMVGSYQEEILKPGRGAKTPDFTRLAYLTFNRVEGRWQYVSMDTRFPVGVMPGYSFGKVESGAPLKLIFEPIAFPGMGKEVEGHMMRSDLVIVRVSADHEIIQQHFIVSDGTEREWLAVQYEYTRRK